MKRIFFFAFILCAQSVFSYNETIDFRNGRYWKNFPIKIGVKESDPIEKERLEALLQESIEIWEEAAGEDIWEFDPNSSNHIRWAKDFAEETSHDPSRTLAVTVRYGVASHFTDVEIVLNPESRELRNSSIFKTVMIHEMGHTVGLDHDDSYSGAIMNSSIQIGVEELTRDDEDGITSVYEQTKERQKTNFVSSLYGKSSDSSKAISCGSIYDASGGNGPGGMMGMILSLLLGMIAVWLPRRVFRRA